MVKIYKIAIQVVLSAAMTAAFAFAGPSAPSDNTRPVEAIKAPLDIAPQALFPQMRFEFDPVFEGAQIRHDFVVENHGEAPLVIKNIRPD